jgi:YcxB-like protein
LKICGRRCVRWGIGSELDIMGIMAAMQIKFTLTPDEYAEAQEYWQRQLSPSRWSQPHYSLIFWIGLILVLCGVLLLITSLWLGGTLCLAYGIFCLAWRGFLRDIRFRREFRRSKTLQGEITMDITEEGLRTSSAYGEGRIQWVTFARYLETPRLFLLSVPPRMFHMIPKRAFASGDLDAARQLLEKKIPPANRNQELLKAPT